MSLALRLDASIPKDKAYELAQKFLKWKKVRRKKYMYLRNYNLSIEQVLEMRVKQNHCCAICLKKLEKGRKTHIDHDHYTGKIRGILCSNCNLGLGNFKDSVTALESAIKYLRDNGE